MDTRSRDRGRSATRLRRRLPKLVVVTDDRVVSAPGFRARAERVLETGGEVVALQLRAHGVTSGRLRELADELRAAAEAAGAGLWINDRLDVAVAVRADGLQLGARSLPVGVARRLLGWTPLIGYSAHGSGEAESALEAGADVVVLGSLYPTASHPGREPLGLASLRELVAGGRPILGIGGITPERAREVIAAGAAGVAVLSGVWEAADEVEAVSLFATAIESAERELEGRKTANRAGAT